MIKVKTYKEAWELAAKLFPNEYEFDEVRSNRAGYQIYYIKVENVDAWISDLGNRLELNYPDGSTDNIYIEDNIAKDTVAVVGMYTEKTVFGEVKVREIKEIIYHYVEGLVNKTLDDGRFGIELTFKDGSLASFGCESVAYVRFE